MLFNSSEFIFVFLPFAVLLHFALARWSVTAAVIATTLTSLAVLRLVESAVRPAAGPLDRRQLLSRRRCAAATTAMRAGC